MTCACLLSAVTWIDRVCLLLTLVTCEWMEWEVLWVTLRVRNSVC